MMSRELFKAINDQINAELWSAYLYLSMSMDCEAKGYKGIANWFYVQFQEEQDHARIFMNYLNSRDEKVVLLPIAEVQTEWDSVLDMYKATITIFTPTEYGKLINEAVACNYNGDYDDSAKIWEKVIRLNCNYEQAYTGMGISQLRSGNYKEAMKNFKLGANKYYYSKAFKEYRWMPS